MRLYKTAILFFILAASLLASCGRRSQMAQLTDIESYIDARPDSALASIRNIDTSALHGRAAKAKFALLHAIALDKNYIDTADTRVIQPAVNWYERHGTAEERMKAYYYFGRVLYNGKQYDKAIVAYSSAEESMPFVNNPKQNGLLCIGLADLYSITYDNTQAKEYLDKAQSYFEQGDNNEYSQIVKYRKAKNYSRLKEWKAAQDSYEELLADSCLTSNMRSLIEGDYASLLVFSPVSDCTTALDIFTRIFKREGKLCGLNQYGAYAYSLSADGQYEQSDSIMAYLSSTKGPNKYYYHYYKHLIQLQRGDYRKAYNSLYQAKNLSDSSYDAAKKISAFTAHENYLHQKEAESRLKLKSKFHLIVNVLLLLSIFSGILAFSFWNKQRRNTEEQGKMSIAIEALRSQVDNLISETRDKDLKINELTRVNTSVKFRYLASLYEVIYPFRKETKDDYDGVLYKRIESIVSNLRHDPSAQKSFEEALDNESEGIMRRFRNDFPELSEKEFQLASYIFAGFDNTTLMLVLGINTLEHTRVIKSRLKSKISKSSVSGKEAYLDYFK